MGFGPFGGEHVTYNLRLVNYKRVYKTNNLISLSTLI